MVDLQLHEVLHLEVVLLLLVAHPLEIQMLMNELGTARESCGDMTSAFLTAVLLMLRAYNHHECSGQNLMC